MTESDDTRELLQLIRLLKPPDMSVLQVAIDVPGSQIATVKNSANDVLWTKMEKSGFARQVPLEIEIPPDLKSFRPKSFTLTDEGRVVVFELVKIAMSEYGH
jgi:hypothetical protein